MKRRPQRAHPIRRVFGEGQSFSPSIVIGPWRLHQSRSLPQPPTNKMNCGQSSFAATPDNGQGYCIQVVQDSTGKQQYVLQLPEGAQLSGNLSMINEHGQQIAVVVSQQYMPTMEERSDTPQSSDHSSPQLVYATVPNARPSSASEVMQVVECEPSTSNSNDGSNFMYMRSPTPQPTGAPDDIMYVNARQYQRIIKRRAARQKLMSEGRIPETRRKFLHESRHKHALARARGEGGKFDSHLENSPEKSDGDQKSTSYVEFRHVPNTYAGIQHHHHQILAPKDNPIGSDCAQML